MSKLHVAAAGAILMVAAGLLFFSAQGKSATFDEPVYLAAGHSYLTTGDYRLNPEHPALLKSWMALALLPAGLNPHLDHPSWTKNWPIQFGRRFVYDNVIKPSQLLLRGRMMIMVLSLATCWLVYRLSTRLYGPGAGLVSLLFCALCPNLIAHGRLATLDAGLACLLMAALSALVAHRRAPGPGRLAVLIAATFLLLQTKYNAVLFLPVAAGALILNSTERGQDMKAAGIWFVAVLLLCLFAHPSAPGLDYFRGLKLALFDRSSLMNPDYPSFLMGRYSTDGFWHYHLVCFALKTPLPALLLAPALAVSFLRRKWSAEEKILLLAAALWMASTFAVKQNLGVRYILPVYPILYVLAGRVAADWLGSRRLNIALAALIIWLAAGTLKSFPHYVPYFNALAGGPSGGIRHLSESNIDWGQDLAGLGQYMREHRIEKINLFYYGIEPPEIHGISYAPISPEQILNPTPGLYAISASILQAPWVDERRQVRFDWLTRYQPIATIGHSIYIYDFY